MPDSVEGRLNRLEADAARAGQRVDDLSNDVRALAPMLGDQIRMEARVEGIERSLADLRDTVRQMRDTIKELGDTIAERDRTATKERSDMRRVLITLSVTILVALISAGATVIASGLHP